RHHERRITWTEGTPGRPEIRPRRWNDDACASNEIGAMREAVIVREREGHVVGDVDCHRSGVIGGVRIPELRAKAVRDTNDEHLIVLNDGVATTERTGFDQLHP